MLCGAQRGVGEAQLDPEDAAEPPIPLRVLRVGLRRVVGEGDSSGPLSRGGGGWWEKPASG